MSSQLFVILVIAVSAFVLAFGCQSPTVLVPGERGPMGIQGQPGAPQYIDVVLSNRSIFSVTPGRKRREINSQILLTLEDIPANEVEAIANKYITKVVKIAEKDSPVKHEINEIFFDTAEALTNGYKYDITFQFQKESSKNCKSFIDAVKKVNRLIGKFQTLTMTCQGGIY
uniref:Uncharacterized protein n=1 Tax=Panagrolaimus sp. PS1159 TaxID=55785 RepID=A0AC35FXX7_9BILA